MSKRLLIVEEALRDGKAHWFSYIQTIARAASRRQFIIEVACNANADQSVRSALSTLPVFEHSVYLDQHRKKWPGERYYSFILHSYRVVKKLWPLLRRQPRYDEVFVPTMLVQHVLAWWYIMTFHPNRPRRVTLFFVATPGVWNAAAGNTVMPRSSVLMKTLLRMLSSRQRRNEVRFGVETRAAKREYEQLTGMPFELFPHPVEFQSAPTNTINEPVEFCCFGFARHEKGSDILAGAINQLEASNALPDVHFKVQWLDPFRMPDGSMCSPDILKGNGRVEVISRSLDESEYLRLLNTTDCMLLPYRNSSYYARLSRVAIEAAFMGIPMIYTKGGWLEEIATEHGAGVGIADESVNELVAAIVIMRNNMAEFRTKAVSKVPAARAYYSADRFMDLLTAP